MAKKLALVIVMLLAFSLAAHAAEKDTGRYQAVNVSTGGQEISLPQVLILDTKEGNLWLWKFWVQKIGQPDMKSGYSLSFQGKLRPGEKMGEVIESFPQ